MAGPSEGNLGGANFEIGANIAPFKEGLKQAEAATQQTADKIVAETKRADDALRNLGAGLGGVGSHIASGGAGGVGGGISGPGLGANVVRGIPPKPSIEDPIEALRKELFGNGVPSRGGGGIGGGGIPGVPGIPGGGGGGVFGLDSQLIGNLIGNAIQMAIHTAMKAYAFGEAIGLAAESAGQQNKRADDELSFKRAQNAERLKAKEDLKADLESRLAAQLDPKTDSFAFAQNELAGQTEYKLKERLRLLEQELIPLRLEDARQRQYAQNRVIGGVSSRLFNEASSIQADQKGTYGLDQLIIGQNTANGLLRDLLSRIQ